MQEPNWLGAFKSLNEVLDDRRTVVLLDEVSWLAHYDDRVAAALKISWDNLLKDRSHLIFVVCGSVSTWIKEKIVDSKAFYGRRSMDIVVPELSLKDALCGPLWFTTGSWLRRFLQTGISMPSCRLDGSLAYSRPDSRPTGNIGTPLLSPRQN